MEEAIGKCQLLPISDPQRRRPVRVVEIESYALCLSVRSGLVAVKQTADNCRYLRNTY